MDYIGEEMGYSIDPLPCDPIVHRYTDGGAKKQFQFAFTSQEEYDQDARINIENSGFFQKFDEWLEEQDFTGTFPELEEGRDSSIIGNFKQRLSLRYKRDKCQVPYRMPPDLCTGGMKAADTKPKIVRRSQRLAFMNTDKTGSTPKYERMTGFTTLTNSKEPKEAFPPVCGRGRRKI